MDISFFRRGIRLARRPAFGPCRELSSPERVVLLPGLELRQSYRQLVKVGDVLRVQDPVAETDDGDSLCTPIAGEVASTDNVLTTDGRRMPGITIVAGESSAGESVDGKEASESLETLVRKAGITQTSSGLRRLSELVEESRAGKCKHLVIRFFDVDPYVGSLETVTAELLDAASDLTVGVGLLKELLGDVTLHFVLEAEQSVSEVERVAAENRCTIHRVNAYDYPRFTDALLAEMVLGNEGTIDPAAVHHCGVLVLDVDTVLDVVDASRGEWATKKTLTILGEGVSTAVRAVIGTPIGDILDAAGAGRQFAKVILGGPLTGTACHDLAYPLTKDIRGITLQGPQEVVVQANQQCIRCGLCVMTCPMRLVPGTLSRYCEYGDWDGAAAAHLFRCIECGCCAYVCPAERSMVQLFSHGKSEIRSQKES